MLTAFRLNVREVLMVGIEIKFGACTLSTVENFGKKCIIWNYTATLFPHDCSEVLRK
jgi:hypothetical protein